MRETRNAKTEDKLTRNYRYMSNDALPNNRHENEKGTGGVAIRTKQEWDYNIQKIARYSHRCMKVATETGISDKTLHILNTYAPQMGYSRAERAEYWRQTKHILSDIPPKDLLIWTTDNNGQIARPEDETGG